MTTTATRTRKGFRVIPGFSNYAVSRNGEIYNINTGNDLVVQRSSKKHWSGEVGINFDEDGQRYYMNMAQIVGDTWGFTQEKTLRKYLGNTTNTNN